MLSVGLKSWGFYGLGKSFFTSTLHLYLIVAAVFGYVGFLAGFFLYETYVLIRCAVKPRGRNIYKQIVIVVVSLLIVGGSFVLSEPGDKTATRALYNRLKGRDINDMHEWLKSEKETDEKGRVPRSKWPPSIDSLFPRGVVVREIHGKQYARIIWGSGMLGSYDLVIGIDLKEAPLSEFEGFEHKLWINSNAFVASEKRPSE